MTKKRCPHADVRDMGCNTDGDRLFLCRNRACNEVLVVRTTRRIATARQRRSMVV